MKKKLLILIAIIFLVTGCTTEYNFVIDDTSIKEEIVSSIPNEDIPSETEKEIELDDEITPFIKKDQFPFEDEHSKYNKKVYKKEDKTLVKLTYDYTYDEFTRSKTYSCFKKHKISNNNGALDIEFSGKFSCLKGDNVTINIFTDKIVNETNADKVDGNKYTWIINEDNVDNTSIILKTNENIEVNSLLIFIIIFIFASLILTLIMYFNSNKKTIIIKND